MSARGAASITYREFSDETPTDRAVAPRYRWRRPESHFRRDGERQSGVVATVRCLAGSRLYMWEMDGGLAQGGRAPVIFPRSPCIAS